MQLLKSSTNSSAQAFFRKILNRYREIHSPHCYNLSETSTIEFSYGQASGHWLRPTIGNLREDQPGCAEGV